MNDVTESGITGSDGGRVVIFDYNHRPVPEGRVLQYLEGWCKALNEGGDVIIGATYELNVIRMAIYQRKIHVPPVLSIVDYRYDADGNEECYERLNTPFYLSGNFEVGVWDKLPSVTDDTLMQLLDREWPIP